MCVPEPLSHNPLALNRGQGLGRSLGALMGKGPVLGKQERGGDRSDMLGVWKPSKKGKAMLDKPGFPRDQPCPTSPPFGSGK